MLGQDTVLERPALDLVEEINHRVVNEYAEAIASLSVAASQAADQQTKTELAKAAERLRDHAESHRALLPPPPESPASLGDYVTRICSTFSRASLAERGIMLVLDTVDIALPAESCWRVGLVLAELIRNAARHGLRGRQGEISVHVALCSGQLVCLVRDSGSRSGSSGPGRGQRLIRSLLSDLGGTVEWSFTEAGSFALVRIPGGLLARPSAAPTDQTLHGEGA